MVGGLLPVSTEVLAHTLGDRTSEPAPLGRAREQQPHLVRAPRVYSRRGDAAGARAGQAAATTSGDTSQRHGFLPCGRFPPARCLLVSNVPSLRPANSSRPRHCRSSPSSAPSHPYDVSSSSAPVRSCLVSAERPTGEQNQETWALPPPTHLPSSGRELAGNMGEIFRNSGRRPDSLSCLARFPRQTFQN